MSPVALIGSAAAGAAAVFMLDPLQGKSRRHRVAQRTNHLSHVLADARGATMRDVQNRAQGIRAEARGLFRNAPVDDEILVDRVRARLGRVASHPGAIEVQVHDGTTTLKGSVLTQEAHHIISSVGKVRGVHRVRSEMSLHRESDVPDLQGTASMQRRRMRPEPLQEYWSPSMRLIGAAGGAVLTAFGMSRQGWPGTLLGLVGLSLAARSITNLPFSRLFGIGAGRRSIVIRKTINIDAPAEHVFDFWSNFENFPRFMAKVQDVRRRGGGMSRWTVAGPAGTPVSFDTEITRMEDGRLIAWKTAPGESVQHAGVVRFEAIGSQRTRLEITMSYNPLAGAVGHAVAVLFGADPKHAMDADLVRFKSLLEDGKTTAHGSQTRIEDIEPQIASNGNRESQPGEISW